jgi:hypothetical protein
MTTLERQQRGVLALIKQRPLDENCDAWVESLQGSREIGMMREIALWWQRFQLEAQCRYTSRLLRRLGSFEREVTKFFQSNPASPYVEELAQAFLESLQDHPELLVRCVAKFELCSIGLHEGNSSSGRIVWDRDPAATMLALETFTPLPSCEPHVEYIVEISAAIPGHIACRSTITR